MFYIDTKSKKARHKLLCDYKLCYVNTWIKKKSSKLSLLLLQDVYNCHDKK